MLCTLKICRSLLRPMRSLWISHQVEINRASARNLFILFSITQFSFALLGLFYGQFSIDQCQMVYRLKYFSVTDGLLDFGTMRVFEENKLSLKMKNQGKHEIAYK